MYTREVKMYISINGEKHVYAFLHLHILKSTLWRYKLFFQKVKPFLPNIVRTEDFFKNLMYLNKN